MSVSSAVPSPTASLMITSPGVAQVSTIGGSGSIASAIVLLTGAAPCALRATSR